MKIQNLDSFIQNTEDPEVNFAMAREYENIGQTGAAISFYLRTAERSQTDVQQYEALLRMALCFEKQKTRDDTESVLLQKAICLMPQRPEAYFLLSRLYEWRKMWHESYFVAVTGLNAVDYNVPPLRTDVQYPGHYAILFQKAVAAWWVGACEESREIFWYLKNNVELADIFANAVNNNLNSLGKPKNLNPVIQFAMPKPEKPVFSPSILRSDWVNPNYMHGAWVVDNFYQDPDSVRKFALAQEYQDNVDGEQGYIGRRTKHQYLFPGLKEEFERIMGRKITRWEEHGMNGRFQTAQAGDPLVYHCDLQSWAGMLYLTPNAPYQTGTTTYAIKGTNTRHNSQPEISQAFQPGSRNFDRTPFETVDVFGNVYNRLVIFNAGYLHSASEYFGFNQQNSRLWQMFFFD